ncbi:lysophospholipase catalytic domain-domain-containing protein [Phakopsora pachyrhizi]|uniref:Lysophospholipase n=1 Tax=Phakopsora pachyrhizi TaxID=170000 RepID=A0AAV0BFN3_PHAPC|nr:lysophospholipase catalytic domain-domain-containing protein [Phakopsora pachyrhizi]
MRARCLFQVFIGVVGVFRDTNCTNKPNRPPRLHRRDPALVTSPSGGYAPIRTSCPEKVVFSSVDESGQVCAKLSDAEQNYVREKASKSIPIWRDYLTRVNLTDFDVDSFLSLAQSKGGIPAETLPNLGIAASGGGARALCVGGSILDAFDSRNKRSVDARVGGILQLSNYLACVSGGCWLAGNWATSNFPSIKSLRQNTWRLTEDNDLWDWNIAKHYPKVYKVVKKKKKAGFPVSIVDAWGRLVSRHFIEDPSTKDPKTGQGVLFSSIRATNAYKNREAPFVIAVATSRPGTKQAFRKDSPEYEFTPEDFAIWHPLLNATLPMQYLGSPPPPSDPRSGTCVNGFDNAGFIMGISSNIFSQGDEPKGKKKHVLVKAIDLFVDDDDFEGKVPNTFKGLSKAVGPDGLEFQDNSKDTLLMADSGFISKNLPIHSLVVPHRKLDVIIASDSVREVFCIPNGTALFSAYSQTKLPGYEGYRFPKIPDSINGTFANLGYNKRPTFFGCNAPPPTPIIVYIPNYFSVAKTDVATGTATFTNDQLDGFFENGFAIATQSKGTTVDPEWPACLACALIDRQVLRSSAQRTSQCKKCFEKYCAAD